MRNLFPKSYCLSVWAISTQEILVTIARQWRNRSLPSYQSPLDFLCPLSREPVSDVLGHSSYRDYPNILSRVTAKERVVKGGVRVLNSTSPVLSKKQHLMNTQRNSGSKHAETSLGGGIFGSFHFLIYDFFILLPFYDA